MTAIGHGPISAVMSYTTLGWGSIESTFIMHVCVAMILLSGGPVIFELPLSHPDLVFTREWGGIYHYRYSWWLYSDDYFWLCPAFLPTVMRFSDLFSEDLSLIFMVLFQLHFRPVISVLTRIRRGSTTEISIMEVVTPWSLRTHIIAYLLFKNIYVNN